MQLLALPLPAPQHSGAHNTALQVLLLQNKHEYDVTKHFSQAETNSSFSID